LTPILDIGATWCEPCHLLDTVFRMPMLQPTMQRMYLIHLDLDEWHDALDSLHVDVNTGIPRVQALDVTGRPSGEPWRPRDVPDSLATLGLNAGWAVSLKSYCENAQHLFAQKTAKTTRPSQQTH